MFIPNLFKIINSFKIKRTINSKLKLFQISVKKVTVDILMKQNIIL